MGTCDCNISNMEQTRETRTDHITLRYPDGAVAGCIGFYEDRPSDGSIRAQLELRFEDNPSALVAPEVGLWATRHEARWQGIMVEMESRQSVTDPMRFSIDIPGQTRSASPDVWHKETPIAIVGRAREIVSALREGCSYPHRGDDCLRRLATYRRLRELADDGGLAELVTLASQSLHA
jgi:hypothetical protein